MRITERVEQGIELAALEENAVGPARRVRAVGLTANVVNGNRRRYPLAVVATAIAELNGHLHESAGQGRLIATGEAEHPSDKGGRPSLLETVVKWEQATLAPDGRALLEGILLPTSTGKDILTLLEHGVPVGVSMRGYGSTKAVKEAGGTVQEVTELSITGFDLVAEPSDPYARILESRRGEKTMEDQEKELQKQLDEAKAALAEQGKKLQEAQQAEVELAERKRIEALEAAIAAATKELVYGDELNRQFVEAVRAAKPADEAGVKGLVEAKRREYDGILAKAKLAGMGKIEVKGPVFEQATGQPEFTKAAFEITERMVDRGAAKRRDWNKVETASERFAKRYLADYDKVYQRQLMAEAQMLAEAEQTSDLSLPYSVQRAVIAEAIPELVAASIFDFGMVDTSPTLVYFEAYAAESGATATITDETYTAVHDTWVSLAHGRVSPGTLVVELGGTSTVKTEYTDYVVDYGAGRVMILSTGTIANSADLDVTYTYNAVRSGEMGAIQRGKGTLSSQTITLAADRLAQQISDEAVTFARSQIGWDATTKTLAMLIRELREMIDQGALRLAIAQAHVAANTGGVWTSASDGYQKLIEKIGVAKVAVQNDNYEPRSIVMSLSNADKLSNWDGFTAAGMRADTMQAPGVLGAGDTGLRIKGLPVFASKHMPDTKIVVCHPELVQHRVLSTKPMTMKGPYPSYSSTNLVAAEQYYVEEYNATVSLIAAKGAYVTVA